MAARMQGPHIGPSLEKCWTDLSQTSYRLGDVVEGQNGKAYRFVQFVDAVAYVAGHLVCLDSAAADDWKVSNDTSGNMAGNHPVGIVFQTVVPTENQYGFVQIAGESAVCLIGSASVIAGDYLKDDGTTDGAMDEATAGTDENICAIALETIADTASGRVMLRGMRY